MLVSWRTFVASRWRNSTPSAVATSRETVARLRRSSLPKWIPALTDWAKLFRASGAELGMLQRPRGSGEEETLRQWSSSPFFGSSQR
jgi:hypothetical protein